MHIVRYAQRHGNKATAREYGCSKDTVKLWRRRVEKEGISGLNEKRDVSRAILHKTTEAEENHIIKCRRQVPCYGPKRLKLFFGIKRSEGAIKRVLKEHGLTRTKRKKYHKRNDLREVKAKYKALTHHQEDSKHHAYIPSGMKNAQADVESAHGLIESEFYDIEDFGSKAEFFRKAQLYQDFFNIVRPNFSKATKTPWEIISKDRPDISPEVLLFPVVHIDALFRFKFSLHQRGQFLPAFAGP